MLLCGLDLLQSPSSAADGDSLSRGGPMSPRPLMLPNRSRWSSPPGLPELAAGEGTNLAPLVHTSAWSAALGDSCVEKPEPRRRMVVGSGSVRAGRLERQSEMPSATLGRRSAGGPSKRRREESRSGSGPSRRQGLSNFESSS